jgi:hypothetical protein
MTMAEIRGEMPPAVKRDISSLRTKLFYGFGSVAFGVKDQGFLYFLLFFYNQVVGLPSAWVSGAIAMALIFDAFADPIVGQISDNLRTRWGRRPTTRYARGPGRSCASASCATTTRPRTAWLCAGPEVRIVHFANAYTPRSGGIRTTVHALGHGYRVAGHEFVLVVPGRQLAFSTTPAEQYPRAGAAATTLAGYISTEQYLWGLHRVLDGLTTSPKRRSPR